MLDFTPESQVKKTLEFNDKLSVTELTPVEEVVSPIRQIKKQFRPCSPIDRSSLSALHTKLAALQQSLFLVQNQLFQMALNPQHRQISTAFKNTGTTGFCFKSPQQFNVSSMTEQIHNQLSQREREMEILKQDMIRHANQNAPRCFVPSPFENKRTMGKFVSPMQAKLPQRETIQTEGSLRKSPLHYPMFEVRDGMTNFGEYLNSEDYSVQIPLMSEKDTSTNQALAHDSQLYEGNLSYPDDTVIDPEGGERHIFQEESLLQEAELSSSRRQKNFEQSRKQVVVEHDDMYTIPSLATLQETKNGLRQSSESPYEFGSLASVSEISRQKFKNVQQPRSKPASFYHFDNYQHSSNSILLRPNERAHENIQETDETCYEQADTSPRVNNESTSPSKNYSLGNAESDQSDILSQSEECEIKQEQPMERETEDTSQVRHLREVIQNQNEQIKAKDELIESMEEMIGKLADETANTIQELKQEKAASEFYQEALKNVLQFSENKLDASEVEEMTRIVENAKGRAQRKYETERLKSQNINEELRQQSRPHSSMIGYRSTTSPGLNSRSMSSPLSPYFADTHRSARCSKLSPFMSNGTKSRVVSQFTLLNPIDTVSQEVKQEELRNSDDEERDNDPKNTSKCLYVSEIPGVQSEQQQPGHNRQSSGSSLTLIKKKKHVRNSTIMSLMPTHNKAIELRQTESPEQQDLMRSQSQSVFAGSPLQGLQQSVSLGGLPLIPSSTHSSTKPSVFELYKSGSMQLLQQATKSSQSCMHDCENCSKMYQTFGSIAAAVMGRAYCSTQSSPYGKRREDEEGWRVRNEMDSHIQSSGVFWKRKAEALIRDKKSLLKEHRQTRSDLFMAQRLNDALHCKLKKQTSMIFDLELGHTHSVIEKSAET